MALAGMLSGLVPLALPACGGASDSEPAPTPLPQKTLDTDRYSAVQDTRTVLISDANAWAGLWAEHKRDQDPAPRAPAVDFAQQMVLGVFIGARPDSCASVQIQKVYRANGKLVVEYQEPPPDPAAVCADLTTHPAQLVVVPRGPGPVEFVRGAPR